jgi:hypothetical protein
VRGVAGRLEHLRERSERGAKNQVSERRGARRSALGGSVTERGKRGRERGSRRGGATRRAGARGVRSRPAGGAGSRPHVAWEGDVRRARTFGRRQSGRERADRWAGTVTAMVSLTGGVGQSAARGERRRGREHASVRGPAREEKGNWAARLHSSVLELFELF